MSHIILPFMQLTVRGGVRLTGTFAYQIEPEVCIKLNLGRDPEEECSGSGSGRDDRCIAVGSGDDRSIKPLITVNYCCAVYCSWPSSYVDLYAYYRIRKFKSKWPVSLHI